MNGLEVGVISADEYELRLAERRADVASRIHWLTVLIAVSQFVAAAFLLTFLVEDDPEFLAPTACGVAASALLAVASAALLGLNWEVATKRLIALAFGPWAILIVEVTAAPLLKLR